MGRFYKTAQPEFIDNFIYQPPWQLMNQVMATKQQGYDNAMQSTELIRNMLDIKHLGFEDDRVKELKEYYNGKIDELATQLAKNPDEYNKIMPVVKNLARELDTDRKEGNISKIEGRYNAWGQWQKENEDLLKGNEKEGIKADPDLYNRLASHWYGDIQKRATPDITAGFAGTKGIGRPDINSKDMREALKEFKANATETSNGMYKINNKWLTEQEVQNAVYDMYMANPNATSYVKQMQMLKDPGFYDEATGKGRDLFQFVDNSGKPLTREQAIQLQDEYNNLSKEQKEKTPFPFSRQLNSEHGYASGIRGWGNILGFKEQKLEEDKFGLDKMQHQYKTAEINLGKSWDSKIQGQKDRAAMSRLIQGKNMDMNKMIVEYGLKDKASQKKFENDLQLIIAENGADSPEGQNAAKMLNGIYAKETMGYIGNPDASYDKDFETVMSNREKSNVPNDGKTYFSAKPGTAAYQENYRLQEATKYAKGKLGNSKEAKEYLDWLGDRRPNEELAKQFLEYKGVYQKPSYSQSIFGNAVDNARWTPGFMKSEQAKKWDKIYEIGEKYEKNVKEWYSNEGKKGIQVQVNPLSYEGKQILLNELNNNANNYFTTDKDGNSHNYSSGFGKVGIKDVVGVTGGNNQSNIGFQVLDNNGETRWVFPNATNNNVKQLSRNLGLLSVSDKNSAFAVEAMNQEVNRINEQLSKGVDVGGYKSNVIDVPGGRVVIKSRPDGKIDIYDKDGNTKIDTYSSTNQFVEYLYK